MTEKQEAVDLFTKMKGFRVKHTHSKKCALVAIDLAERILTEYGKDNDELQNMDDQFRWLDNIRKEIKEI